jgi:hypothetical protein
LLEVAEEDMMYNVIDDRKSDKPPTVCKVKLGSREYHQEEDGCKRMS